MTPASRDFRARLRESAPHFPAVAADDKTLGQRLDDGSCGGPSAPAPLSAAPVPPLHTPSSSGARGGAGASIDPLEREAILAEVSAALAGDGPIGFPAPRPDLSLGRVWDARDVEPARSRAVRGERRRNAVVFAIVGTLLAAAIVAACVLVGR